MFSTFFNQFWHAICRLPNNSTAARKYQEVLHARISDGWGKSKFHPLCSRDSLLQIAGNLKMKQERPTKCSLLKVLAICIPAQATSDHPLLVFVYLRFTPNPGNVHALCFLFMLISNGWLDCCALYLKRLQHQQHTRSGSTHTGVLTHRCECRCVSRFASMDH